MLQKLILQEMQLLPELAQREVFNFLIFTKYKYLGEQKMNKETEKRPKFGCGSVKVTMAKDFDMPLDDFKEYM